VAEAIHCPSCSTRYRLRPERLRPSIRRARCFTCGEVFPLGDLAPLPPPEAATATASFDQAEVAAALEHVPTAALEHVPTAAPEPVPAAPSSLTLGDLESTDAEILEKTLSGLSAPFPGIPGEAAPIEAAQVAEIAAPPAPPAALVPEAGEDTLTGSYSSARDAISKLFAGIPDLPPATKVSKDPSSMDMEATLSALEATLGKGGDTPQALPTHPEGDEPTSAGNPPAALHAPSTTTLRLSQDDLRAALRAGVPEQPTEALRPSDLMAPLPEPAIPAATPFQAQSHTPVVPIEEGGGERLRLKIGDEIYPSLTMAQLTAWIEEGRILEHHLVARQHSENWLEAHKVPGLRPVFERLRRERSGAAPAFDSPILEIAPKKSLFGGLFGKN